MMGKKASAFGKKTAVLVSHGDEQKEASLGVTGKIQKLLCVEGRKLVAIEAVIARGGIEEIQKISPPTADKGCHAVAVIEGAGKSVRLPSVAQNNGQDIFTPQTFDF